MYTKEQASKLKQEFWTVFGQYMAPVPSAEGEKINWVNYKTGFKELFFRMHADNKFAEIAIEIAHKDIEIQQLYFEQFKAFKIIFDEIAGENWEWKLHIPNENGKITSKIYLQHPANIFDRTQWPGMITFFKTQILALDAFWADARYGFESLK